jgi:hypothetical protein
LQHQFKNLGKLHRVVVSSAGLDLPAGAQLAGGRSAFDVHPTVEFVQFGDFWNDRGSSYRNNFFDPYWGDRRTFHRNNSYDPYNPFNRRPQPQAYESIKPPAPRKVETPPAETVLVIGDSFLGRRQQVLDGLRPFGRVQMRIVANARRGHVDLPRDEDDGGSPPELNRLSATEPLRKQAPPLGARFHHHL